MALPTLGVKDKDGADQTINTLRSARANAADSAGVVLSNEDLAAIGATNETAPASDTAASGLNGRLQRIAQRITSLIALVPSALGRAAAAASFSTVLSTEDKASIDAITTAIAAVGTDVTPQPATSGGYTIFRSLDLDESEEEVKATAGQLYKLRITNFSTSARYVKIYNATAANVTVGTTTPVDTIPVPPAAAAGNPTVITESYGAAGVAFGTAITMAATTALADNDTGAPSANDVVVTAYYK